MRFNEAERARAEQLFDQHMTAKGMGGWFKRIGKKDQDIWCNAARKMMRETL